MIRIKTGLRSFGLCVWILFFVNQLQAQLDQNAQALDTVSKTLRDSIYRNETAGELSPGKGFSLVKTKYGTLNISLYAIVRYLNQLPGEQTWQDHLGRTRDFTGRNDFPLASGHDLVLRFLY